MELLLHLGLSSHTDSVLLTSVNCLYYFHIFKYNISRSHDSNRNNSNSYLNFITIIGALLCYCYNFTNYEIENDCT